MAKQLIDISDIDVYEKIYISPHIDDVVLSCPASIIADRMAKTSVLVITVFGRYLDRIVEQKRRQEEAAASRKGGYDFIFGEFCDAPCREPRLRTFRGIFGGMAGSDQAVIDSVSGWLYDIIDRAKPRAILAPLGVGRHIDHRLVHAAIKNLLRMPSQIDAWWYEDRPYVFADNATELRLRELGYQASMDLAVFLESSLLMPYAKDINANRIFRLAYCNMHKKLAEDLKASDFLPPYRLLTFENYSEPWNLIASYHSQVMKIVEDSHVYESLARKLSEKLNGSSVYIERQWQLPLVST